MPLPKTIIERVWRRTTIGAPDDCWPWFGALGASGQGVLGFKKRLYATDREVYRHHHGPINTDNSIIHTCGNKLCNNPSHLIAFTERDSAKLLEHFCEPVTESGCLLWTGAATSKGYGQLQLDNTKWTAHRLSWVLANGPISDGLLVLHHCDTPLCFRPEHLYLGNHSNNAIDRCNRGRSRNSVVTPDVVLRVREDCLHLPTNAVAAKYGLKPAHVSCIKHRYLWKHF